MTFGVGTLRQVAAVGLLLGSAGCLPTGQSPLDEQREPYFLAGKAKVNSMDYKGAIEAFEKALEVNPRSASAHLELALLLEKNEMDYAAAIYHFERYLRLRPQSEYTEIIQQRILACKQELAKTVALAPVTQPMQRELERLTVENRELRRQVEAWQAYFATQLRAGTNAPTALPGQSTVSLSAPSVSAAPTAGAASSATGAASGQPSPPSGVRRHTVKAGETPYAIAKKYGVRLDALMAANPGLEPKRLRVGQTLTIPAP